MTKKENFLKGIFKENPVFVLVLGMCPVLGVTATVEGALGMGIAFTLVLIMSNFLISAVRRWIPGEVRIPAYIVIIASLVTMVELLMQAYTMSLYDKLGIFIPLIVVNCNILGRAEAYASKNNVVDSTIDAIGMGIGFTLALFLISTVREVLGAGSFLGFGIKIFEYMEPATIFISPAGAFITVGLLMAIINAIVNKRQEKASKE
jgi:Na+-translocating ferredoxin:NAD+ oxidoreductase subunit E